MENEIISNINSLYNDLIGFIKSGRKEIKNYEKEKYSYEALIFSQILGFFFIFLIEDDNKFLINKSKLNDAIYKDLFTRENFKLNGSDYFSWLSKMYDPQFADKINKLNIGESLETNFFVNETFTKQNDSSITLSIKLRPINHFFVIKNRSKQFVSNREIRRKLFSDNGAELDKKGVLFKFLGKNGECDIFGYLYNKKIIDNIPYICQHSVSCLRPDLTNYLEKSNINISEFNNISDFDVLKIIRNCFAHHKIDYLYYKTPWFCIKLQEYDDSKPLYISFSWLLCLMNFILIDNINAIKEKDSTFNNFGLNIMKEFVLMCEQRIFSFPGYEEEINKPVSASKMQNQLFAVTIYKLCNAIFCSRLVEDYCFRTKNKVSLKVLNNDEIEYINKVLEKATFNVKYYKRKAKNRPHMDDVNDEKPVNIKKKILSVIRTAIAHNTFKFEIINSANGSSQKLIFTIETPEPSGKTIEYVSGSLDNFSLLCDSIINNL